MIRIRTVLLSFFTVFLLITAGCGNKHQESEQKSEQAMPSLPYAKDEGITDSSARPSGYSGSEEGQQDEPLFKRKIIKHAMLNLNVVELESAMASLQKLIDQSGGYVQSSSIRGIETSKREAYYLIRVPEGHFVSILDQLGSLGKTTFISQKGDDVTQQFYDNEARIKNLSSQEDAVRKLLERAQKMEDILKIQQELFRIRGEIEVLQGQNRFLDNQSSMSTFEVTLQEAKLSEMADGSPWGKAKAGFIDSLKGVYAFAIDLLVFLISYLPYILLIFALSALSIWLYARKKTNGDKDVGPS